MSERRKRSILFFVTVLTASVFCIFLYFCDNKYTHKGIQPAGGVLAFSEGGAEEGLIYLIHGWMLYPGVLLSPEDFMSGSPDEYMVYTSIGEFTHFDNLGAKKDPHGSASYVLYLELPEEKATYALGLPEIFSSYRLYINERLYLQMGNPNSEAYQPLTQNRLVTFEAAGRTRILLSVSDYSHYYSGIVYPPSFGSPLRLNTERGILLGVCIFINTIGFIAGVCSLYIGLKTKHRYAILYFALCVVMCVFTSYTILHSAFAFRVFPWYAAELVSGYLLTFLVIVLHNRICGIKGIQGAVSSGAAALFCLLALCYGLFSTQLTVPVMRLFSGLIFLFKACSAGYLLITAAYNLKDNDKQAAPLFYASAFYAAIFVWDRVLPAFEPMRFGWFPEWGSLVLVFAIGYTLWKEIVSTYANSLAFAEEHRQITRQLAMQMEYAKQIAAYSEESRRMTHDFRQHLRAISGFIGKIEAGGESERYTRELAEYIEGIAQTAAGAQHSLKGAFSKNSAVDALLQYYFACAQGYGIAADFQLSLPEEFILNDVELCTMLGNLLENAVDACLHTREGNRMLSIISRINGSDILIRIENSYDGQYYQSGNRFLSRKRGKVRCGIGLESVQRIVEQHGGSLNIYPMEVIFRVGIILPLKLGVK